MRLFGQFERLMATAGVASPGGGGGHAGTSTPSGSGGESGGGALVPAGGGSDGAVHDAEFVDGGEGGTEGGQQTGKTGQLVESGRISQQHGRPILETIRQAHGTAAAQRVTQALILADRFRREIPGGFKEIENLRNGIETYGGDNGLKELKADAEHLAAMDQKYMASDPSFINDITADDESQQAFVGLMPHVMSRWAQIDPAGRAWFTADQFARGMDTARVPVLNARIVDILNMNQDKLPPGLLESFNELTEAINAISYRAAAQKPQRKQVDPAILSERQRLHQERQQMTKDSWFQALGSKRKDIFESSLRQLLGTRQLTSDERTEVKGYYDMAVRPQVERRMANIDRFLANGDRDGFLKTEAAFYQKAIPEALRRAVAKLAPVAGTKARVPAARPQSGPVRPPVKGVTRVATMPQDLDPVRTTREMLRENKGVRRDGSVVEWTR